jgi:hypothetical protein
VIDADEVQIRTALLCQFRFFASSLTTEKDYYMRCSLPTHCSVKEVVTLGPGLGLVLEVSVATICFETWGLTFPLPFFSLPNPLQNLESRPTGLTPMGDFSPSLLNLKLSVFPVNTTRWAPYGTQLVCIWAIGRDPAGKLSREADGNHMRY